MPSFFLDKPKSDKKTFIFVFENCVDGRLKYSIREKVLPSQWDPVTQRPVVIKGESLSLKALHIAISRIYNEVETLKASCNILTDRFTKDKVLEVIQDTLKHKEKNGKIKFKEAAEEIINEMEYGRMLTPRGKKKYSVGTIKNYRQSLDCLVSFSNDTKVSLEFLNVSIQTYNRFIEWCHKQGWTTNYIGQHLKNWKCLMEASRIKGLHRNNIHNSKEFKTLSEETYDIALTEAELKAITEVDLSGNILYDNARDWFVIGCYTGLRVSDLKRLNSDKINGNTILVMNEKTDEKVVLPIHPNVAAILKKYKGKFPPFMHDQVINDNIKPVAKLAGIEGKELYSVTEGGKRKDYYLDRWEMVSMHTGRRTMITLTRKNGLPDSIVMKLTGIKKPQTLIKYDKLKPEQAAQIAAEHPFFKQQTILQV